MNLQPVQRAEVGLWLIQEAILELLDQNPNGLNPSELSRQLGLKSPEDPKLGVAYAVLQLMVASGKAEKGEGLHPPYFRQSTQ